MTKNLICFLYQANTSLCTLAKVSIISDQNMIKLTPIERTAMEVINSDVPYNEVLADCELPPLSMYTRKDMLQVKTP